jgi:predicted nucleotidyltransferase
MKPADGVAPSVAGLSRVVDRLVRAFRPERIVLYGSRAKGKAHAGSDTDLLIIAHLPGSLEPHRRRARQLCADSFPPIDIALATPDEVAAAAEAPSPFLASILGTGLTIYERS